jgi:outer membrane protein OmpA-like peptidoglycan-associated protein
VNATADTARELLARLCRAEAADLARAGDHEAALRALADLESEHGEDLETLDLLARVHAQRGNVTAAEATWRRILAVDPDHAPARAGAELATAIRTGRRRVRPLPVRSAGTAALVLLLLAGGSVGVAAPWHGHPAPHPPAARPARSPERVRSTASDAGTDQLRVRLQELGAGLAGPGVRIEQRDRDLRVVFDSGLFPPDSDHLAPAGERALVELGRRLRGKPVHVTVLGHSLPLGPGSPTGGSAVGLTRATTAAGTLAGTAELPLTAFTVASADQAAPPWPGTTPQADARNRTVTLLVTPA